MLVVGATVHLCVGGLQGNSLYYLLNFFINLKLFEKHFFSAHYLLAVKNDQEVEDG